VQSLVEPEALRPIVEQFCDEPVEHIAPLGNGHIHQTYRVTLAGGRGQLVLQRVNTDVFSNLDAVMQNIVRVTSHLRARLTRENASDIDRRILSLRFTRGGKAHHVDALLGAFRMFVFIDGSLTLQRLASVDEGFEAARACGELARLLSDLPPALLHTTLPDFHATDRRFDGLRQIVAQDPVGRATLVEPEWQRLQALEPLAREAAAWDLRLRITHNDTKLDNVLFDAATHRALCLIDLDTVMPGYLAYDFGDLVRSCLCTVDEDARDASQVGVQFELFEPLVRGYLSEARDLSPLELRSLARGPLWIVLELAIRFLADFVHGDRYFKIARPEHNLDRARVMLALLERFIERESELLQIVERVAAEAS
jgi:hypothetical protein